MCHLLEKNIGVPFTTLFKYEFNSITFVTYNIIHVRWSNLDLEKRMRQG